MQKATGNCGLFLENKRQRMIFLFEVVNQEYCTLLHGQAASSQNNTEHPQMFRCSERVTPGGPGFLQSKKMFFSQKWKHKEKIEDKIKSHCGVYEL